MDVYTHKERERAGSRGAYILDEWNDDRVVCISCIQSLPEKKGVKYIFLLSFFLPYKFYVLQRRVWIFIFLFFKKREKQQRKRRRKTRKKYNNKLMGGLVGSFPLSFIWLPFLAMFSNFFLLLKRKEVRKKEKNEIKMFYNLGGFVCRDLFVPLLSGVYNWDIHTAADWIPYPHV